MASPCSGLFLQDDPDGISGCDITGMNAQASGEKSYAQLLQTALLAEFLPKEHSG